MVPHPPLAQWACLTVGISAGFLFLLELQSDREPVSGNEGSGR